MVPERCIIVTLLMQTDAKMVVGDGDSERDTNAEGVTQRCCRCGTRAGCRASLAKSRRFGGEDSVQELFFDVALMGYRGVEPAVGRAAAQVFDDPVASAELGEESNDSSEIDNKG